MLPVDSVTCTSLAVPENVTEEATPEAAPPPVRFIIAVLLAPAATGSVYVACVLSLLSVQGTLTTSLLSESCITAYHFWFVSVSSAVALAEAFSPKVLTFTVTVSVLPTTVLEPVPPAMSNVLPWAIVWFVPVSPVNVKVVNWFVFVSVLDHGTFTTNWLDEFFWIP